MKELVFEELSLKQKLGMTMVATISKFGPEEPYGDFDYNLNYTLDLIRSHALGAVWVLPSIERFDEAMAKIKEAADYPLLILTDAENGLGGYNIGGPNALGMTGSEEAAYAFGKITATTAKKMGYNVICNPILDMSYKWDQCNKNIRSMGHDKYQVTALAAAQARGIHDAGVLTVAKHYPGGDNPLDIDAHMAEVYCELTADELLDYHLYPYLELMRENLLDGMMTTHRKFINIDPDYPASLSKKVISIIRNRGFDGFLLTDALDMMGIKAKFGNIRPKGMCIEAGNDLTLPWRTTREAYESLCTCYEEGVLSEERLNEAVRRVLDAQRKVMEMNDICPEYDEKELQIFNEIDHNAIYTHIDEGLPTSISRDGKYYFVLLVRSETDISDDGKVTVDTFSNGWFFPSKITDRIQSLFPNSKVRAISQFPTPNQSYTVLQESLGYDDVIFVTFANCPAFSGSDHLTRRILALIKAMQFTDRISSVVHFGNPYVLEELEHIPRIIIGGASEAGSLAAIDVLAGERVAKGVPTYDVKFK